MFEWTHAFVPDNFVCHYTANYYCLLTNGKNAKNSAVHWKRPVLNPILLHVTRTQCNR